jgi:hypothetical protein
VTGDFCPSEQTPDDETASSIFRRFTRRHTPTFEMKIKSATLGFHRLRTQEGSQELDIEAMVFESDS